MTISIRSQEDWKSELADVGLRTVLDPMIVRCAELFLKGANQAANADLTWSLLDANIYAIGMFFDSLVLNERIPIFNYGDTFDMHLNFDDRVWQQLNLRDEVLFDVDVQWQAYRMVKEAALRELKKVYSGEHQIKAETRKSIQQELVAAEYHWNPRLEDVEALLPSEEDKVMASFLLGGLIFTGYAQMLGGEHVLQPKRSRLFLEASLNISGQRQMLEEALFNELKQRARSQISEIPWVPTFFPYLLSRADAPADMLQEALRLRRSPEIKDYRRWLSQITPGRIPLNMQTDVKRIVARIDERLRGASYLPSVKLTLAVANVVGGTIPIPGEIDFDPVLQNLWGWLLASLPSKRYRKLLARAVIAEREYASLTEAVKAKWKAAP